MANRHPSLEGFHLRIALHNTRPMEIGAVLAALTLNGTEGTYLNLGMAKSFGFGKCKVGMEDDVKLSGFKHDAAYYMHEFEKEMAVFTYGNGLQSWASTNSISQLVNILSEHSNEDVRMMELNDYTESKKENKNPFNTLQESSKPIKSWLTEEDWTEIKTKAEEVGKQMAFERLKSEKAPSYAEAEQHIAMAEKLEQEQKYSEAINELKKARDVYDEIDAAFERHQMQSDTAVCKKTIEDKIKSLTERLTAGAATGGNNTLGEDLDKRNQNNGGYMRTTFKQCFDCVNNRIKKTKALSPEDKAALENTVKRLLANPDKKEKKTLGDFSQYPWPNLMKYLDESVCHSLYEGYVKSK